MRVDLLRQLRARPGEAMKSSARRAFSSLPIFVATALFVGCGASGNNGTGANGGAGTTSTSNGGTGGTTSTGKGGSGGDEFLFDAGTSDGGFDPDAGCASQSAEATLTKKPVDIIVVIDNSGSMTQEIVGVQDNINQNFASIIEASGLDYRVIMVTRHGKATSGQSVCVEAPLSGIPAGGCATPPSQPVNNPPKFYHYSTEIASRDSWCKILSTFNVPDEFNLAPTGWQEWLRPDSFKTFIEITDDGVGCSYNGKSYQDSNNATNGPTTAAAFDTDLLALSPANFGDANARNYRFYSIVAMDFNNPATKPYEPTDPLITAKCPTAANNGTGHQALSILTGALRFPICDTTSYDVVFQAIAEGVISGAKVSCEFAVPDPPPGKTIDLKTVQVRWTHGGSMALTTFDQVADLASCAPGKFYIEGGKTIKLCPETCDAVQMDDDAKIDVVFGCEGGVN
jgi:hypothetical protein